MIWLALLIPVIAVAVLAKFYPKQMHIWEYVIVFLVPIICIVGGKYASTYSQTHDTEYWNSYGVQAVYEERWDEEVPCRHPRYVTETYTDSDGRTQSRTVQDGYEHMYDVDDHPPKWYLKDNIGSRIRIDKNYFERICKMWNMRQFKDMRRSYHSIDGDAYISNYDKVFDHTIPICKPHRYENRVQCSKSVFNFREVNPEDKAKYGLFDYPPKSIFGFKTILGANNPTALLRLQKYNALNGSRKQLHMMVLVFKDQPLEAGLFQEAYWKGGNKNEFIVCIGTKGDDIKWTKVISWTEQEKLKIEMARKIKEIKKLDLVQVVDMMGSEVTKGFVRKEFEDFSYIAVRPTTRAIIITYLITFLVTGIISVIVAKNNWHFDSNRNRWSHRGRYGRF